MTRLFGIVVVMSVMATQFANAATIQIVCPPEIKTSQALGSKESGWQPFIDKINDDGNRLARMQVFDGPPADNATLKPEHKNLPNEHALQTWTFKGQRERDIWLACTYQNTTIQLTKNLGRKVRSCSTTTNQFDVPIKIECQ